MTIEQIGIDAIKDYAGASREARAYAFLYAAFKRTEVSQNPVRDALDCLLPFVGPYINALSGKQITSDGVQDFLKKTYGFELPLYAVDQLMPSFQREGWVTYHKPTRAYISKQVVAQEFKVSKAEVETDFDRVTEELEKYANKVGFNAKPPSGDWGEALVSFLRSSTDTPQVKITKVKGTLLEPSKVEKAIVGYFVQKLHDENPILFDRLVRIFMGALIEEFIASVVEVGQINLGTPVYVFFDTAVLLRLLGCSGKLLKIATEELTRYLQDLGFQTFYYPGNESEVANILDTIIYVKDSGRELEGETADAISRGEVTVTDIRLLRSSFPEKLARYNIFSADSLPEEESQNPHYQIDERGFAEYLKQESKSKGRVYGFQNRENDAGYLAKTMRFRRGSKSRDIATSRAIFATSNRFLASSSRRYLVSTKVINASHCPPMLSVGQLATIAWLMKDQKLVPEKAGRELLSNCYAAIRPDQEWFRNFREGIESAIKDGEDVADISNRTMMLQAARRIAQEESFSDSQVVRELNMAEILQRAEAEAENDAEVRAIDFDRRLDEVRAQAIVDRDVAVNLATSKAVEQVKLSNRASAVRKANRLIYIFKYAVLFTFVGSILYGFYVQSTPNPSQVPWIVTAISLPFQILSALDQFGVSIAARYVNWVRNKIASMFLA